eukprot:TRINITY_DN13708_c1_g2_i1.p1 TRINITY_DN13708_c1_g2~~TRINITY_DN13708_c1_g2_i1.p1  ORF type:complete len:395 (+),score=47.76 TRINITY_DN13708_c1_g2_i1:36-1220(+)
MAGCFAFFYDTSSLEWGESVLAEAILNSANQAENGTPNPGDFQKEVPVSNSMVGSKVLKVTDYAPKVFKYLREDRAFGNNISHEAWVKEWEETKAKPPRGELGSGKSGATFVPSAHGYYLIKTIDKREVQVQMDSLQDYVAHCKKHPNTLLMRHFALLRIDEMSPTGKVARTKYLLVFENIVSIPQTLKLTTQKWDLKGRVPKPGKLPHPARDPGVIRKDKDLLRDFRLPPATYKDVIKQLSSDTRYLKKHNLMDYSLFLVTSNVDLSLDQRKKLMTTTTPAGGIPTDILRTVLRDDPSLSLREGSHRYHNGVLSNDGTEIFFLGIIDTLTNYHALKKLANCCKKFAFYSDQLSTVPADEYGDRFYRFMTDIFHEHAREPTVVGVSAFSQLGPR